MSTIPTSGATAGASQTADVQKAFRQADFLKIMLAEVVNQNPLDPQDTGKLVDNMRKLQELANTTYQKFRADVSWAQELTGETVNVQQQALTPAEAEDLRNQGLKPDIGYGSATGRITGFRVVKETVYVTVGDRDYPVDNVKQVVPDGREGQRLAEISAAVLGRTVTWITDAGAIRSGRVGDVSYAQDGGVALNVEGTSVPYGWVVRISAGA